MLTTTDSSPLTTTPPSNPFSPILRKTIGISICILGNILISIALNIQKHVHNTLAGTGKNYCVNFTWWFGMAIIGLGELGNFGAYGFAPASTIAPLGSTGVISNAIIAVIFMKEKIRFRDVVGIVWAIVGAYLLIVYSSKYEPMLDAEAIVEYLRHYALLVFILIEAAIFLMIFFLHRDEKRVNPITMCLQVGLLGSPTIIAAKAVSSMIAMTFLWGKSQLGYPIFWMMIAIMILSIIAQVRYLNAAMQRYDATVVMPIYFVFFTIVAISSGIIFYQELWNLKAIQVTMSLLGATLSFGGVYLISGGREVEDEEEEALLKNEKDTDPEVPPRSKEHSPSSNPATDTDETPQFITIESSAPEVSADTNHDDGSTEQPASKVTSHTE